MSNTAKNGSSTNALYNTNQDLSCDPNTTAGSLLQLANGNTGLTATLQTVYDGTGQATVMQLSTTYANFTALKYNGTIISANSFLTAGGAVTFSGAYTFTGTLTATTSVTFPTSGTLITANGTSTLTNKTYDTAGTGNSFSINGTAITNVTGTGSAVLATSPTLVTPILGTPTSGTLTNCTGTASSLTSGTCTTIPNLTGDVTSVGNVTTLTGTKGIWTPTVTGSSVNPTAITYSVQYGEYTQFGNVIHYSARITISGLTIGSASGDLQITGLGVVNGGGNTQQGACSIANLTFAGYCTAAVESGLNLIKIYQNATGTSTVVTPITALTSTTNITVTGWYFTS